MEETIPYLGAHSCQASSLQPLTIPGFWDSAAIQGLLWVSVDVFGQTDEVANDTTLG